MECSPESPTNASRLRESVISPSHIKHQNATDHFMLSPRTMTADNIRINQTHLTSETQALNKPCAFEFSESKLEKLDS
jgi:hypothetical protein